MLARARRLRLHRSHAGPGANHSAVAGGARRYRFRADRYWQDGGLRAARTAALGSQRKRPASVRDGAAAPRVLVLAPTRELAQQVADQVVRYGRHLQVKTVCIYGGAPYPVQNSQLSRGVDVLVATPGRLLDHFERGRIDLSQLEVLVLDEADRMLDMGFIEDVEKIASRSPATRQTVLFSATFDGAIARLAGGC